MVYHHQVFLHDIIKQLAVCGDMAMFSLMQFTHMGVSILFVLTLVNRTQTTAYS